MSNLFAFAQDAAREALQRGKSAGEQALSAAKAQAHKAHSHVSDLMESARIKEQVVVEGQPLLLLKQLAEGGFGYVYFAKDAANGKEYAVKRMIVQEREAMELAAAEVALLQRLSHPNIVSLVASCHGPREGAPGEAKVGEGGGGEGRWRELHAAPQVEHREGGRAGTQRPDGLL